MGKNGSKVQKCSRNRGGNDLKRKNIPIFGAKMAIKGKTTKICRGNMSRKKGKYLRQKKKAKRGKTAPYLLEKGPRQGKKSPYLEESLPKMLRNVNIWGKNGYKEQNAPIFRAKLSIKRHGHIWGKEGGKGKSFPNGVAKLAIKGKSVPIIRAKLARKCKISLYLGENGLEEEEFQTICWKTCQKK